MLIWAAMGCGGEDTDALDTEPGPATPLPTTSACAPLVTSQANTRIIVEGIGPDGVDDISIEHDPELCRVWMVASSIADTQIGNRNIRVIEPFLAYSDDGGANWTVEGVLMQSEVPTDNPPEYDGEDAVWQNAVPALVYDATAAVDVRWSVYWHRYLHVADGADPRKLEYGGIYRRRAGTPEALAVASDEFLFSGLGYDIAGDPLYKSTHLGTPTLPLHGLDARLADCVAFTEPGPLSATTGLYLALGCLDSGGRASIFMLHGTAIGWSFVSTLLDQPEDSDLGGAHTGFSAPSLAMGVVPYLIASPQLNNGDHQGCVVHPFSSIAAGTLVDVDGSGADIVTQLGARHGGTDAGACDYDAGAVNIGLSHGEVFSNTDPYARQFRSLEMLP